MAAPRRWTSPHYGSHVSKQSAAPAEAEVGRRDLRTIFAIQALRALLYGFGSVLIGASLARAGYSDARVGLVFTAMLAGFAVTSISVPLERNRAFARYNAVAYLAGSLGALAAGGPDFFRRFFPAVPASQRFLLAYTVIGLACAFLASRLSIRMEAGEELTAERKFPLVRSKKRVAALSGLFALDSFGGGFVVNSFIVFWYQRRFGASTETMGLVFFSAGLLQSFSSIAAGWVANRIGLLNTMVFTHLPSNILLILVPFMPNLSLAIAMLLARFAISQMDVPARQAYVVSVVDPGERTAAASYTNTARYVVRPAGPALGGYLMQTISRSAPFVAAGALKIVYDLLLLATFRRVREAD
jgi:hypothetical protein